MSDQPINVTRAFLPPREEFDDLLDQVFATRVLTNNGPLHRRLESAIRERLEAPHLLLMANGTVAIQLALRALEVKDEVITTPFSYVATTSAILWEGLKPVFADIQEDTLCIDPDRIEEAITPRTTAILATHVFGIPCDVERIETIANRHGLKVIYDAAHAFDVHIKGRPITAFGDASTLSFHATKLFHTVEGGATVVHNPEHEQRLRLMRSFGHIYDEHFGLGVNAKMSEMHAAMGLAVLPYTERNVMERGALTSRYDAALADLPVTRQTIPGHVTRNYAYYPVFLKDLEQREAVLECLARHQVFARRYFYPSLDALPYVQSVACPVSRSMAGRALCLPLYNGMTEDEQDRVISAMYVAMGGMPTSQRNPGP